MSMRSTAVYPGTFDPLTRGHEDIARRAASIFGRVVLAVAANPNKTPMFSVEERVELARGVLADLKNVEITGYSGLTVDFARAHDLAVIVRGCARCRISSSSFSSRAWAGTCSRTSKRVHGAEGEIHLHFLDAGARDREPGR
jgi:cytidyltransferase-like protein